MKETTVIPVMRKETKRIKMIFELQKDLIENQVICDHCHGTGLEIDDNVYGISGDPLSIKTRFPYKNQSLSWCRHCYNGVQEKCPACGSLRGKQDRECSCGVSDKERKEKWEQKEKERWEKAEKISFQEAWGIYECLYIENIDEYVFNDDDFDDLIEDRGLYVLHDESLRVYATRKDTISIDAGYIAENACSYLHEDASERCDIEGLQVILDKWCEEQTGTATYYPDYSVGVI